MKTSLIQETVLPDDLSLESVIWTAFLVILEGAETGRRFLLSKDIVTIGRSKETDLCIEDIRISRVHACLQRSDENEFLLFDKNSTNGTYVNSLEVKKTLLKDQDFIRVGNTVLKFVSSTSPEQAHYDEIYRQSHMDGQLPIYNKHYLLKKIDEEIIRCNRYNSYTSVILFDVDRLKQINQDHSVTAGDAVLSQLIEVIKKRIRDSDAICRYSGENFAIVMPHTNQQQAYIVAEHLRDLVAKTTFSHANTGINITVSVGVSCYFVNNTFPCTKELLLVQAKKALHQAKLSGRDKVVLFDLPSAE